MTISSENNRNQYEGNDVTTVFPYDFRIADQDHLLVTFTDAAGTEATLIIGTDYTVSGVGEALGGNVTYPVSGSELADNEYITILRKVPQTQEVDLKNQTSPQAEVLESAYDKDVTMIQQLQEEVDRCLKVAISSLDDPEIIDGTVAEQVLACQSARDDAEAAALAAEGAFKYAPMNIKTDDFSLISANRSYLNIMNAGTAKAFTMPLIVEGHVYLIKNIGAGVLTITPAGGQTTEVATLETDESVILSGDATNSKWRSLSNIIADASETVKGKVELATDAETITGTATDKVITPANIQAKVSSETAKGIIELATQAEVDAGTDDLRVVTALKLANAGAISLAASGYHTMTNGLIIQWGVTANLAQTSSIVVTLPIAFPTTIYTAVASTDAVVTSGATMTDTYCQKTSTTQITVSRATNSGGAAGTGVVNWIAIGN